MDKALGWLSDAFWFSMIRLFINSDTDYRGFRATNRLRRKEITNSEAYKILEGN